MSPSALDVNNFEDKSEFRPSNPSSQLDKNPNPLGALLSLLLLLLALPIYHFSAPVLFQMGCSCGPKESPQRTTSGRPPITPDTRNNHRDTGTAPPRRQSSYILAWSRTLALSQLQQHSPGMESRLFDVYPAMS